MKKKRKKEKKRIKAQIRVKSVSIVEVNSCHSVRKPGWLGEITKGHRGINEEKKRCEMKEHRNTTIHQIHL